MSFAPSITVTVNAVAKILPMINQDQFTGLYELYETTKKYSLKITHKRDKPNATGQIYSRHAVDLSMTTFAVVGVSPEKVNRCYMTFVLLDGDTVDENYIMNALSTWLTASSSANALRIEGWES